MMLLDDTKTTSYIHNLEQELADIDAEELRVAFLPGVSQTLAAVPRSVLLEPQPQNNQLVLYREPTSLTVPRDHDTVRRAIMESKERIRAKQSCTRTQRAELVARMPDKNDAVSMGHANQHGAEEICDDEDAMAIDDGP